MTNKEKEIWLQEQKKLEEELWETIANAHEIMSKIIMIKSILEEEEN